MVAAAPIQSNDDGIQTILRAHPEMRRFIDRVAQNSKRFYPGAEVVLHGPQVEDDPPLILTVRAMRKMADFTEATDRFAQWLGEQSDYDFDLISVAPLPCWSRTE